MRLNMLPSSLLSLFAITLLQPVSAGLIPDLLDGLQDLQNLVKRCDNPCGYYGQLCCESNQYCYTDANDQAQCGNGAVATTTVYQASAVQSQSTGGSWRVFTTTYVQTDLKTVTATYSTYVPVVTATATSTCQWSLGQTPCGNTCCSSGQYCQQLGVCALVPGSSVYYSSLATVTVTNTASAPLRPTSNSVTTLTSTGHVSSTTAFQTPVGTGGATAGMSQSSSGGLSGGAIAGIVIGVILGIILLLLICACCCFKGLLDGLLAIFGLGPRRRERREEVEVYEERHHHSGGGGGGRTWFGTRPGGNTVVEEKRKESSGFAGLLGVGTFLAGLAVILGLKRRRDERKDDKTGSSYSYYDSEYYSSSSSSSAGRTRGSRSRSRSRI